MLTPKTIRSYRKTKGCVYPVRVNGNTSIFKGGWLSKNLV